MKTLQILTLACALLLSYVLPAGATQTDNYGIHAVPAPGVVAIDGKLNDWDLSGQTLMCYDLESLRDIYSAQVAAMYDANNLYIGIHWQDPSPMGNSHDPRYQAAKGWAGDCVQLRFKTDRIAHVTAWYYAAKQEPALQISYGKSLTEPFGGRDVQFFQAQGWNLEQGAAMAFQKDADNRGYIQEIKLPWKLITDNKSYHAGDQFGMGVELLWGEADWPVHRYADNLQPGTTSREFFWTAHNAWGPVFLEPKGHLKLPEPAYMVAYRKATEAEAGQGPVAISYNLPKAARVSLAIDDATGKRIRNLVPASQRKAGQNTEHWDGLDDNGKPVPPGNYTFKALYHDGIHANYVMSFANPGHPTWQTPDGRGAFYGDHSAPHAAAAGGSYVALACPMGEAGQPLIGLDLSGQRLWGQANRMAFGSGIIALATDGKTLWVGAEGNPPTVYRVDIATGKYAPWHQTAKDNSGAAYQILDLPLTAPLPEANAANGPGLSAIALHDGTLAVCLLHNSTIKLLDAETGEAKAELALDAPRAATFASDGSLIVLSQGHLLYLTRAGKSSPFNRQTFSDGYALASDAAGNVYLSVRGTEQNVKVFSPQGQLLRDIGKRGGRPAVGPYNADGMRNPAGLALDSKGRLWVTEETLNPKRTSVWDAQTGKLLQDLPGTTSYAGAGAINPFDPTMAFSDNTVYRINLQTGAWHPLYSLGQRDDPNDIFPLRIDSHVRVLTRNGDTYVFTSDRTGGLRCAMLRGDQWRAAGFVGTVRGANDPEVNTNFKHPFLQNHVGELVAWSDRNGDGLAQSDELTFAKPLLDGQPATFTNTYWGHLPDDRGTVTYMVAGRRDVLTQFSLNGYAPNGAPLYDIAHPKFAQLDQPLVSGGEGAIMGGGQGRVYLNQDPLMAVDEGGKVLFTYPSRHVSVHGSHTARSSRPGYLIGPSMVLGTADLGRDIGEVFYLNGNLGENYLFTADGLYVQSLFKDTRGYFDTPNQAVSGMSMDATTAGGESFGGNFTRTPDGKTYVTLGGTDARVMEVTGLNTIHRFTGRFAYTPAEYNAAQVLMQQRSLEANAPKLYTIARAAAPVAIDGKPNEWPELLDDSKSLLEIQENPQQRYARVQARYDANNLYLAYRVFVPRDAPQNAGQDWHLLFKTGDAVDVMLGPAESPNGAGNTRLLMTRLGGQPIAVLNQKVAPGSPATEKYVFAAPWHTLAFDRVTQAREVQVATGQINGGYFVEAAIPWKALGLQPQAGLKLRGDVGVLLGDNSGGSTVARQYWSNKATGLVNDIPGEADLTPQLWGTFVLE